MAKLTYLSHSAWLVESGGFTIVVDPFLDGNPTATVKPAEIDANYIIVTHAHGDHLGDAIPMAKASNGTIITNFEISNYCAAQGANSHPMHIGGSHMFPFGKVKLTHALHGSSFPDGSYGGNPAGIVFNVEGKNIYHTGDTGLFSDMKLIGELDKIDIMLVNIGDNFTMGVDDALKAVEFVQPKMVIPMHFKTFDIIDVEPDEFVKKLIEKGFNGLVLKPNESFEF
jgi:L-ascorbate metabolism protein UlaG (beta-lactamase superfamily)